MSKRFRRFVGGLLVIANLLSCNTVIFADDRIENNMPTENVAVVETEPEKQAETEETEETVETEKTEKETEIENSETIPVEADADPKPTPTSASEQESDKDPTETAQVVDDTEETTAAETSETTVPSDTPAPTETEETTADTTQTTEATSESTTEPSETSATETSGTSAATPTPSATPVPEAAKAPAETLTRKVLDSSGKTYTVTASYDADTAIPYDAELVVKELTSGKAYNDYYDKTLEAMGDLEVGYVRIFDISIVKDGVEYEPAEGTTVNVKIQLDDDLGQDVSVVHIKDDKEAEIVQDLNVENKEGTEITFEADGFSAYAIVNKNFEIYNYDWECAKSISDIVEYGENGFYVTSEGVSNSANYYLTGGIVHNISGNSDRDGLDATLTQYSTVPTDLNLQKYYFSKVAGTNDQFIIYTKTDDGPENYIKQTPVAGNKPARNGLTFVTDINDATVFTLTKKDNYNSFFVYTNPQANTYYYWNRNTNTGGVGAIASYNDGQTPNSTSSTVDKNRFPVKLMFKTDGNTTDPYDLNNKLYGMMFYDTGLAGKGLTDKSSAAGTLDVLTMPVLSKKNNINEKLYVPNDSDLTLWRFHWVEDDKYYLSTTVDGNTKYLQIGDSGVSISDTPQKIKIIPGIDANQGKISLAAGNHVISYSGEIENGYVIDGPNAGVYRWLNLVELSELTSDYVLTYAATKVSVSDPRLTDGTKLIIYTRVWNASKKRYDFYAVDHDGTLVPVYEDGDEIQWIGDRINTLLWDYTIYYPKGAAHTIETENGYYELYNEYSEKFISPHADSDEALANGKIGINMLGRTNGDYYSPIIAWDAANYAYAGIRTDNGKIISYLIYDDIPNHESKDFYFATITDLTITDDLTEVETVNNSDYGITMKMINFDNNGNNWRTGPQSTFLGNTDGGTVTTSKTGLLSANLGSDGYPTNSSGQSLKDLYSGSALKDANHLFLDSTYRSSGYFEYDSASNFAHFNEDSGDFTVYQELGTTDLTNSTSLQHGLFMPYNNITPGNYAANRNMYDVFKQQLTSDSPRKYESLYDIGTPDYNFGLELETSFVQTPDGKDNWDHDIIYEFVGDDDFWLYVDGVLVLDLGGIHSAIQGTVNFCTGDVYNQGLPVSAQHTSLYEIFRKNYLDQGHTQEETEQYLSGIFRLNDNNQYVFKDYSTHTMKIFYMERGQGSSNLHMRFNQSSVKPNTVILSKELENIDSTESFAASFPFQIWVQYVDDAPYQLLSNINENIKVHYKGTTKNVKYSENYSIDGCNYQCVYFLEAGEECEIAVPDEAIKYYIVECAIDTDIYGPVKANGSTLTPTPPSDTDAVYDTARKDFGVEPAEVKDRTSVEYVNAVKPEAIRTVSFKKVLWDENGIDGGTQLHDDDARFDFRLYFGSEHETESELDLANMYIYHVKDEDGNYCKWDPSANGGKGDFVKLRDGAVDYSSFTTAEKRTVSFTTSMYGAVSKIPAFYTVEIRQVLAGTKYKVEERYEEIPDGFSLIKCVIIDNQTPGGRDVETNSAVGLVDFGDDPSVEVHNLKGYAIRIYKEWADEQFMDLRENTYFAVYIGDELQNDLIYELPYGDETLYWYFKQLKAGTTLADYHVYEVDIEDPVITNGKVSGYTSIRPLKGADNAIQLSGRLKGETAIEHVTYTATYSSSNVSNNIRVDTITNDRAGLTIYKTDVQEPAPAPLAGARFELRDEDSNLIGTFTSDDLGFVAKAFLRKNVDYSLTEIKSPNRYHGLDGSLIVRLNNDGTVSVTPSSSSDSARFEVDNSDPDNPKLYVRNIRYDFTISKKDKNTQQPIKDVKFELHKLRTVGGVTVVDFLPIPGYENLYTDANGIVPSIDSSLPAGTYELREVETPITHHSLNYYVMFTVTETGDIRINSVHPEIELHTTEVTEFGEKRLLFTLLIYNIPISDEFTITKEVRGNLGNKNETFPVKVTFTAQDQATIGNVTMEVNGVDTDTYDFTALNEGEIRFNIKHGDRVTFKGLDDSTHFSVEETDTKGYTPSVYVNNILIGNNLDKTSGTTGMERLIKFVNTREGVIPTGLRNSFKRSVGILSAMMAAAVVFSIFFRKRREDEED